MKCQKTGLPKFKLVKEFPDVSTDDSNIIFINPAMKAAFYDECYRLYLLHLKNTDKSQYESFIEIERLTKETSGFGMVFYMFQRVAPTFVDEGPINLLRDAIQKAVFQHDFDQLCVFMQIASFRWAFLEKSMKFTAQSRIGRAGNQWTNTLGFKISEDIFRECEAGKITWNDAYTKIIEVLVKNKDIALGMLNDLKKNLKRYKATSSVQKNTRSACDKIYNLYTDETPNEDDIKSCFLSIKSLRSSLRSRYNRWRKQMRGKLIIHFESINRSFYINELKETFWKKLPPWPIEECLKEYSPSFQASISILINEAEKLCTNDDLKS